MARTKLRRCQMTQHRSRSEYVDLPVLYDDGVTLVYQNHCGEIFVENKRNRNSTLRVSPYGDGFTITAHSGQLVPWSVNGLSAILVRPVK
jgi:hypothetical protein